MNQESKIQCYQSAYQMLKEIQYVKELCYPEKKRNLEFSCEIGDIYVAYNMRLKTDLLTIRGTKKYPGFTDSKLSEIAHKILETKDYLFTAYEESITFQLSVSVACVPDPEALKMMNRKTEEFIYFLFEIATFPDGVEIHLEPMKEGETNVREKLLERVMEKNVEHEAIQKVNLVEEHPNLIIENTSEDAPAVQSESVNKDDSNEDDLDEFPFTDLEPTEDVPEDSVREEVFPKKEQLINSEVTEDHENMGHPLESEFDKKERMLLQIEWIAEKNAEIKRKEASLQAREASADEMEETAGKLMEAAKKETAYWEEIRDQYEEKNQNIEEKKTALSELETHLKRREQSLKDRESSYQKSKEEYKKQKENIDKLTRECMKKELDLENETRSLQIIKNQINEEKDLLIKEKKQVHQELDRCRKQLEIEKKEHDSILVKLKKDFESILRSKELDYETSVSKQKEKYELKLKETNDKKTASLTKLQEENQSLTHRCNDLQDTLKEKDAMLQAAQNDNKNLKLEVEQQMSKNWEEKINMQSKTLEGIRSENNELKRNLQEYEQEKESYLQKLDFYESVAKEKNQVLLEKEKEINKLKYDIELYKQSETKLGVPDDILQDFAETRKQKRQLERELEDVKNECIALESSFKEKEKKIQEEGTVMRAKFDAEKEALLPRNRAAKIQEDLNKNGINLSYNDDDGGVCLVGTRNDCNLFIDVEKNILIVRKSVSRPNKLTRKIQEWNENEITEAYYCDKKYLICKKSLVDAEIDVNKVLQKFTLIK